jgi:hypothetical protein
VDLVACHTYLKGLNNIRIDPNVQFIMPLTFRTATFDRNVFSDQRHTYDFCCMEDEIALYEMFQRLIVGGGGDGGVA